MREIKASDLKDDVQFAGIDRMIAEHGYQNRSEAIRDLTRAGMTQIAEIASGGQSGVAALVYVYEHEARRRARVM